MSESPAASAAGGAEVAQGARGRGPAAGSAGRPGREDGVGREGGGPGEPPRGRGRGRGRRIALGRAAVDPVDLDAAAGAIEAAIRGGRSLRIATVNVDFLRLARARADFRRALRTADLRTMDGRLVLWLCRLQGRASAGGAQVTGHDLVQRCCVLGAERAWRLALVGGPPGSAARVAARLEQEHPGLRVAGTDGGRFAADGTAERPAELDRFLRELRPDVILVGLGAPKQDLWLERNLKRVGPAVGIGVGGVIETLDGGLPRAPRWMQVAGLESAFQLAIRPGRYARRYLWDDPPELARLVAEGVRRRRRRRRRLRRGGDRDRGRC